MAPLQQPESPHAQRQLSAVAHGPRGTSHSLAGGPVRRLASHTEPRFANDWIGATLRLCPDRGLVRVGSGSVEWILATADFEALLAAVPEAATPPGVAVEWSPGLGRVLVPGAFERAGTSFFTLARQPAAACG
jgi:hypothetical protein